MEDSFSRINELAHRNAELVAENARLKANLAEALGIVEGSQRVLENFKYLLTARNRLDEAVNTHKRNCNK